MKYKVEFYTMDHPLSEVRKWMRKGFNAWSNPRIDAYLTKYGCPTLEFVETTVRILNSFNMFQLAIDSIV